MQKASTTPLDDLRISAQRIKASLRAGVPNSAGCLVSAKADISQLLADLESSDIAVPTALTPSQDVMDATIWSAQAFVACNSVISQCRQAKARDHFGKVKGHVKSRFADYLRSLDGTGKISSFLGRAGHDGSMRVTHLQAGATSLNFSQDGDLFRYHSFYDSGHVGLDYFFIQPT
jgi:hypothetical protein